MTPTSISVGDTDQGRANTSTFTANLVSDYKMLYYRRIKSYLPQDMRRECLDSLGFEIYFEIDDIDNYKKSDVFFQCHTNEPSSYQPVISLDTEEYVDPLQKPGMPHHHEVIEQELFVHDYIEEGIKVNWKKARKVYNRIKRYESRSVRKSQLDNDDSI